jgi:hypothetical protein
MLRMTRATLPHIVTTNTVSFRIERSVMRDLPLLSLYYEGKLFIPTTFDYYINPFDIVQMAE